MLTGAVQVGLVAASTAESMRLAMMIEREHRKASEDIENDPWTEQERFAEAERTGASEGYSLMTKNDFGNLRIKAAQAIPVRQRGVSDAIDQHVLGGQVRTEEDIREWAAVARLPEEEVKSLCAGLRNVPIETPEQRVSYFKAQSELITAMAEYDPEKDMGDRGYYAIKRMIREGLPSEQRETAMKALAQVQGSEGSNASRLRSRVFRRIDSFSGAGMLGEKGTDRQGNLVDPNKEITRQRNALLLKHDIQKFLLKNPEAAQREVDERLTGWLRNAGATRRGAGIFRQRLLPRR